MPSARVHALQLDGWLAVLLAGCALVSLAACSEDDGAAQSATAPTSSLAVVTSGPVATDTAPSASDAVGSTSSSIAPEPTGVAGVDDPDVFCAAWARYSGTLQALGVAAAFGGLSQADIARVEMLAAPALAQAVDDIGSAWPTELVAERSVVLGDLVGPFGRRAQKALAELTTSGATDADMAVLRAAWLEALRHRRTEEPVIDVVGVPAALAPIVDAAAAAFDAAVTPFADDPSLATESVQAPLTDRYLADHCPDLASSGVGDAV